MWDITSMVPEYPLISFERPTRFSKSKKASGSSIMRSCGLRSIFLIIDKSLYSPPLILSTVFSSTRSERLPDRIETALKEMIFSVNPEYRDSKEKNMFITFSVYGGYYTYSKNQNYSLEEKVDFISESAKKLLE